ncbi:MAG TPA: hypothetical protein VEK33_13200 [Terriglobales bacterium]|nr:hypothetical protein [Terriglobales bacterium]
MAFRALRLSVWVGLISWTAWGQNLPAWNATVGGGVGFPQSGAANFANNGATFVGGGGPNLMRFLGLDAEFMWQDLPIKKNLISALDVPKASARARLYAVTFNAIVPIPTHGKVGFYAIGGGGWYHRSGELTVSTYIPGTVCTPFDLFLINCENGLVPSKTRLASTSSDAWGSNIGGGITYRFGASPLKLFAGVRYHHVPTKQLDTNLLPLTIGLSW